MSDSAQNVDFFRQPLAEMIDLRHPLAVLASRGCPNGIKLSIINKPAWAAAPRQPDAFAQSSCLV